MKICFLADGSRKGGVFIREWINYFVKNHELSLVTFNKPSGIDERVDTHYIPRIETGKLMKTLSLPNFILKFRGLIKKINPDILYAHYVLHYGLAGALSGFHPFGLSPLGSDIATVPDRVQIFRYATTFALKKADLIQVQDLLSAERVMELGADERKISVIPWGVNLEKFKTRKVEKEYDVINVNRYNADTFIKAISIVKNDIPNIKVLWLGVKGEHHLIDLLKKFDVLKNVKLESFVNNQDIPNYLSKARIFVDGFYPGHDKGGHSYGVALHEAMACGIPTIVANRQEIYKLKGKNKWYFGWTFDGNRHEDLANKIISLLENDGEKKKISRKNREIVEKRFNFSKNMEKIENEMERIVDSYKQKSLDKGE